MKVHVYEKSFLILGGFLLIGCLAGLVYASTAHDIHLPGKVGTVEPTKVYATPPFNKPGVHQTGPNSYDVVVVGQAWAFFPAEIRVPAHAEVTFIGTSVDVIHGFYIEGSRLNMMLIPGQISRNTYRFTTPGETRLIICHEYCGTGHHLMHGKVIVEPPTTTAGRQSGSAESRQAAAAVNVNAEHHHVTAEGGR